MRYGRSVWVGAVGALLALAASCGPEPLDLEAPPDAGELAADAGTTSDAGTAEGVRVRIMAANLTSGNNQSYDPGEGLRILQGTHPDVVLIQEFNYGDNSATTLRNLVTSTFGDTFQYYRESEASDAIPNGIISRWPILDAGAWNDSTNAGSNRDYVWARIDVPGPRDLWAVSVHLWSSGGATGRDTEAKELVRFIQASVPADAYLVIGGDFNTSSNTETCLGTFSAVVTTSGPYPVDQSGDGDTNSTRSKPYDRVFVDGDLGAYHVPVVIGANSFPSGLVVDTRVYSPLSGLSPARSTDSGATNMQHMGVVKDFLIPAQ